MATPTPDQIRFILESGILAPSADNHHQIRFEVEEDLLKVWFSGGQLPETGGYKRALAMLSLGAVSENLTISATRFAIQADPELFPNPAEPDLVFQVKWGLGGGEADPLWKEIPRRHTNRSVHFHGPSMGPEEQSTFVRAATHFPGCQLIWLDSPEMKAQVLRLMRLAEGERFRNRLLHEELFSTIRFEAGWQQSCEEGLPPAALGIERPLRPAFALLRHWPIMRLVNLMGGYRFLGWRAAHIPCRLAPHLGLVTVDQFDDRTIFDAGRTFQRAWLGATRLGLALQPMPASAIFALPGATHEGVPAPLQNYLQQGWQAMFKSSQPLMLFRIGRANPPAITTARKPVEFYFAKH
jgi:hypothetical protein